MLTRENAATKELKELMSTNQLSPAEVKLLVDSLEADPNTMDEEGNSLLARLAKENTKGQYSNVIDHLKKYHDAKLILANFNSAYLTASTNITLTDNLIGKGNFANVFLGRLDAAEVAIKVMDYNKQSFLVYS